MCDRFAVGRVVPLQVKPSSDFVTALLELTQSDDAVRALSNATHDVRMGLEVWTRVLHSELIHLLTWTSRRLRGRLSPVAGMPALKRVSAVISFLPSYGEALHVVRRAVPFAALGIPTSCGFPIPKREAIDAVEHLGQWLAVADSLRVLKDDCLDAARHCGSRATTAVVTGRAASVESIRQAAEWQEILGAAGRCSVIVGEDAAPVEHLAKVTCERQLEISCARVGGVLHAESLSESSRVRRWGGNVWTDSGENLGECLQRLHPSIVLTPQSDGQHELLQSICGYQLFHCDTDGQPAERSGFGADPRYGWPGDYVL